MRTKKKQHARREIIVPKHDEILALLERFGRSPSGLRNKAITICLWRAGLRISEALALNPRDIDLDTGEIRVQRGKGGKSRMSVVDEAWLPEIRRWAEKRAALGVDGRKRFFVQITNGKRLRKLGQPVGASHVRHALARKGRQAGLPYRLHPHALRHAFASELVAEGTPLNVIQSALGHSSLVVTSVYVQKIRPADVVKALRNRPAPQPA